MDVRRQTDSWRLGAEEDMAAARSLLARGHLRQALFFAHLGIEKMLKAHVTRATNDVPLRTHDLLRLADTARVSLSQEQRESLARLQQYCLEGRYPGFESSDPSRNEADSVLTDAEELLSWLQSLLK